MGTSTNIAKSKVKISKYQNMRTAQSEVKVPLVLSSRFPSIIVCMLAFLEKVLYYVALDSKFSATIISQCACLICLKNLKSLKKERKRKRIYLKIYLIVESTFQMGR